MYSSRTRLSVQGVFYAGNVKVFTHKIINTPPSVKICPICRSSSRFHLSYRQPARSPAPSSGFSRTYHLFFNTGSTTTAARLCRRFTSKGSPRFSPKEESHVTILERLHALENNVRIYGYSTIRWGLGLVAVMALGVYTFRDSLRENVADEVAEVASRSLGDENLVLKANEVTKIVLKDILNDPSTMELVSSFFLGILRTEMVNRGALELTWNVLQDPTTQREINTLCTRTVRNLLEDKETMKHLQQTIKLLIENEQTRNSCKQLLHELAKDEAIQAFMAEFLSDVIASTTVTERAVMLSKDVTEQVMGDSHIQEETGNALWNAFVYSVTPSWLSTKD